MSNRRSRTTQRPLPLHQTRTQSQGMQKRSRNSAKERERVQLQSNVLSRIQRLQPVQIPLERSFQDYQDQPSNHSLPVPNVNFTDVFSQVNTQRPNSSSRSSPFYPQSYGLRNLKGYRTPKTPAIPIGGSTNHSESIGSSSPTYWDANRVESPPMHLQSSSGSPANRTGALNYSQATGNSTQTYFDEYRMDSSPMHLQPSSGSHANRTGRLERYITEPGESQGAVSEAEQVLHEAQEMISMFDTGPRTPTAPKGQRGRRRTVPYSPSEWQAKKKGLSRALKGIKIRLQYIDDVQEDYDYFFYGRSRTRKNLILYSHRLEGIHKSSSMQIIHDELQKFTMNPKSVAPVTYEERFPAAGLPSNPSLEDSYGHFSKTQTAKSVKTIFTMLQRAGFIREARSRSANLDWYMNRFKPFFLRESRISAVMLWSAFSDMQYAGSTGVGYKYKELKRKHFIGLMQSLDLLAKARGDPPLPSDVDFSGNVLLRAASTAVVLPQPTIVDVVSGTPSISQGNGSAPVNISPPVTQFNLDFRIGFFRFFRFSRYIRFRG